MLTNEQINAFKNVFPSAVENEPMSKHTSFRLGGPARLYVVAGSTDEILKAVQTADELNMPWFIYGGGSNLLVSDDGYGGLVIQAANRALRVEGNSLFAESGVISALAARKVTDAGLGGFEWAAGLPGTIGGALFGNAGCFGGETGDMVTFVDAYRVHDRQRVRLAKEECRFGYRDSLFKHEPHVILGGEWQFAPSTDPAASKAKLEKIVLERKEKQPLDQSSAGCMFKNYDFHDEQEIDILKRHAEIPAPMLANKRIATGWLIERAGLLGQRIGNVEVSKKHGNFLVVSGQARAQDVVALISLIKMKVRDGFGIELEDEVQYLGF